MNILSYFGGQVNQLSSIKFFLGRKRLDFNRLLEALQAFYAFSADGDGYPPRRENPSIGKTDIQRIRQRRNRLGFRFLQTQDRSVLLSFDMQCAASGNLMQVNLHDANFCFRRSTTPAGTNGSTFPPSRATSFTIRELR